MNLQTLGRQWLLPWGARLVAALVTLAPMAASTYGEAVQRAQEFADLPASTNLLTTSSPSLVTTNVGGTNFIKTVTMMKASSWSNYYLPYAGWSAPSSNAVGYESWVTFEPELKGYISARTNEFVTPTMDGLVQRVEQALGMSNTATHTMAVELWVTEEAIFRPAVNWSLTNASTFRDWTGQDINGPSWFTGIYGQSYFSWFTNRQATVYSGPNPFPWTGLGYTYDWHSATNSPGLVGLSEFVIGAEQHFYVGNGIQADEYFGLAVPEPGAAGMLAAGGVLLCLMVRRRKRNG